MTIGELTSYVYNSYGQRTRKVTPTGTSLFYYDLEGQLISETDMGQSLESNYIWADNMPVWLYGINQVSTTTGKGNNRVTTITYGNEFVYLHTDNINTPRLATDGATEVVWEWDYDSFGRTRADEDPDGDSSLLLSKLRFPGQYFDSESGLHHNHFRYFDPLAGRYLTSDPAGLVGGFNTSGYVSGNPLINTDPHGLLTQVHIGGNNWYGHAATNINGTVYSSGRYPVPAQSPSLGGLVGPNVLVTRSNSGYLTAHPSTTTYTLNLTAQQEANLSQYYQNMVSQATQHPNRSNWHILPNNYSFVGNNCANTVVNGLKSALPWYQSLSLPGLATPQTLQLNLLVSPFLVQ